MGENTHPAQSIQRRAAHPEHDAVAHEVSGWFTASAPEIGYEVSEHWYGYQSEIGPGQTRVILRVADPGQAPGGWSSGALTSPASPSGQR